MADQYCPEGTNHPQCISRIPVSSNFPTLDRIRSETKRFGQEIVNPYVSPAEEDEIKRTALSVVFGTILTIIGFATAIVVSNQFATLFPSDWFTALLVVIGAVGLSLVIGIVEVRIHRAALKTRYFKDEKIPETKPVTGPKHPDALKIRALYEHAHKLCTQADLGQSIDQTMVEGSLALNVRNICTEEVFHALVRKAPIEFTFEPPTKQELISPPKGTSSIPPTSSLRNELIKELKQVLAQKFGET